MKKEELTQRKKLEMKIRSGYLKMRNLENLKFLWKKEQFGLKLLNQQKFWDTRIQGKP